MNDTLLQITRVFDASPERVFDAWLSEDWASWIGPHDIRGELELLEPRVGGRYRILMHKPDGNILTVGGVYRQIDRPRTLVFTWLWEHGGAETVVTLDFRPEGRGTSLTLRHEGFCTVDRRDGHLRGWTSCLEKLSNHLK